MTNGMKSGAGDDPFADDGDDGDEREGGDEEEHSAESDPFEEPTSTATSRPDTEADEPEPRVPDHPADEASQLPWIHRRDGVQDDRTPKTLHYTEHTLALEDSLVDDVERALGVDVSKTDAREAAYLVGMAHVDEVANLLRDWGYAVE